MVKTKLEDLSLADAGKIVNATKKTIQRLETRKSNLGIDIGEKEQKKSNLTQECIDLKGKIKARNDAADAKIKEREDQAVVTEDEANRLKSEGIAFKSRYENALKITEKTKREYRAQIETGAQTEEKKLGIIKTLNELVETIRTTLATL